MTDAILLFGGSFDPIHNGHLAIARFAAAHLKVRRVVLIPSGRPPHKQGSPAASADDRLAMCRLAVEGDALFEVSDWELHRSGPSYTLLTVQEFRQRLGPATRIYWLIGADMLRDLGTWHRIGELADLCTFVSVGRPGVPRPDPARVLPGLSARQQAEIAAHMLEGPQVDISATAIRRRVAAGERIADLVPPPVAAYIAARALYRAEG